MVWFIELLARSMAEAVAEELAIPAMLFTVKGSIACCKMGIAFPNVDA